MKLSRRVSALFIAAVLLVSTYPALAADIVIEGVGTISEQRVTTLSPDAELSVSSAKNLSGSFIQERVIEVEPSGGTTPVVAFGTTLYGKSTASYVANFLKERGKEVVAAINGDFFMTDTGIPIGIVVTEGILRTSDAGQNAIGFRADGSAFIGKPLLGISVTPEGGQAVSIDYVNKTRKNYGTYLMTPDYSATTKATDDGLYVILDSLSGQLTVGGTVTGRVQKVVRSTAVQDITAGTMVLTATVENNNYLKLSSFAEGQNVTINITSPDPVWSEAKYAVGGGDLLVKDGEALSGLDATRAPRTAVGIDALGKLYFYTVDGRQSEWSVGYGLGELAKRMVSLGCVTALNLDGGGSTAMLASFPGQDTLDVITRPSDGSLRMGANYIMLLNDSPKSEIVDKLYLYGGASTVIGGGIINYTLKATDKNYHTIPVSGPVSWSVSGDKATITADGKLTAGDKSGSVTVTATYAGMSVSQELRIVGSPDEIRLIDSDTGLAIDGLLLQPSDVVNISAVCIVDGEAVATSAASLTWTLPDEIGTLKDGVLTAVAYGGRTGTLTVSAGSTSKKARVTVGGGDFAVEHFGGKTAQIEAGALNIRASIQSDPSYVLYGKSSGKIVYNFVDTEELYLRAAWELPIDAAYLHMWVMGDGSQNEMDIAITLDDGKQVIVEVGVMDNREYQLYSVRLPAGAARISGVSLRRLDDERDTGTVYIDSIIASPEALLAQTRPAINDFAADLSRTPNAALITAIVLEAGRAVRPENISFEYDGNEAGFVYDSATGLLTTVQLARPDGYLHRAVITVKGENGLLSRRVLEIDLRGEGKNDGGVFIDAIGHWSAPYAEALYNRGVLDGNTSLNADGKPVYRPTDNLTRAEFAVMMAHAMGLDTSRYAAVVLPFSDAESIPAAAKNAVAAMYVEGIINGKTNTSGDIFFDPNATITRAEIMTIIGRTLPKGYSEAPLSFTDAADIPAYARGYISVLVGIGVTSGYTDGTVKPNAPVTRAEGIRLLYGV